MVPPDSNKLIVGNIYSFAATSTNIIGESTFSDLNIIRIGIGNAPTAPTNLRLDYFTFAGGLYVKWEAVSGAGLPVLGYILQRRAKSVNTDWITVYDGKYDASTTGADVSPGLTFKESYEFRVAAVNIN